MHLLDPDHPAMKAISKLRRRKSHYLKLVKQSGFEDKGLVEHEAIGLQQYRVDHKLAELIDDTDPKYIPYIMQSFDNIIGYFEDRAWESFDPYYWIKAVLNLPKTILNFGIDIVRHAITGK